MPRLLHYATSAALLALGLLGGLWTAWSVLVPPPAPPAAFHISDHQIEKGPGRLPLLRWYSEERIERVGTAVLLDGGAVGLEFYSAGAVGPDENALLLEAGPQTLWALRSERMEQRLQQSAQDFFSNTGQALERVLTSPAFKDDYAPAFRRIVTASLEAAWHLPETKQAAQATFQSYRELLVEEVVTPGVPILVDEARTALKESFAADPTRFVGRLLGGSLDPETFAIALDRTLENPAVGEQIDSTLKHALSSTETEQLALAFSRALLEELAQRQEALDLLRRLLADPRFSDSFVELRMLSLMELRDVSELVLGLGVTEGVHPVTALVIRAFLQLDPPYFVLLAPVPVAQRLNAGELPAGYLMTPLDLP